DSCKTSAHQRRHAPPAPCCAGYGQPAAPPVRRTHTTAAALPAPIRRGLTISTRTTCVGAHRRAPVRSDYVSYQVVPTDPPPTPPAPPHSESPRKSSGTANATGRSPAAGTAGDT